MARELTNMTRPHHWYHV